MCELEHGESVGVWSKERSEIMSQMTKKQERHKSLECRSSSYFFFLHVVFKYCAQQWVKLDPLSGCSSYVKAVSKHRVRDKWKTCWKEEKPENLIAMVKTMKGLIYFSKGYK